MHAYQQIQLPPTPLQSNQATGEMQSLTLGKLNEKQLAEFNIPNAEEIRKRYDSNFNFLLNQFGYQYKQYYSQREEMNNKINKIDIKKRSNISILLIIGSSFEIKSSRYTKGTYQKNAEDLSSALFIRHIFHNAFGIPYDQILITSTQNSDFYVNDINIDLISTPKRIFNGIDDVNITPQNVDNNDFYFSFKNYEDFLFHQSINVTQIGSYQYKFYIKDDFSHIIMPFNINIIKHKLKTNINSNLLVFFLDHGYTGGYSEDLPYQFFIERLLQIECNHIYVFNDSCYSGSIISLINYSYKFQEIFPNVNDPMLQSVLFNFLANLSKVDRSLVPDAIMNKIDLIDSYDISNKTKDELKKIIKNIDPSMYLKISDLVISLDVEYQSVRCVPQHFIEFSKKSTIFVSSEYNKISLTLPGRKYNVSSREEPTIRVFGSIFTSIFIESFLDQNRSSSLEDFISCASELFTKYKDQYMNIIINQNERKEREAESTFQITKEDIISFFSTNLKKQLFYNQKNDWPNFKSIMIDENYWNIDKTEVKDDDYKDVFFCMFKIHDKQTKVPNPNNYGPRRGYYNMDKFMKDFELAVDLLFNENHENRKFSVLSSIKEEELTTKICDGYAQFIGAIRPVINCYNWPAIMKLKVPMTLFFDATNPNDSNKYKDFFAKAFTSILPFWNHIEL